MRFKVLKYLEGQRLHVIKGCDQSSPPYNYSFLCDLCASGDIENSPEMRQSLIGKTVEIGRLIPLTAIAANVRIVEETP